MSSEIQRNDSAESEKKIGNIGSYESIPSFNHDDDDILCDFDTLPVACFSDVSHLWRNAHDSCINLDENTVRPTAYDLRTNEIESRQISLYEAILLLKVPENLELEAYNINHFLSTQAPINIANSTIVKLDVDGLKKVATTNSMVNSFIESISKSEAQNDEHVNAYHWDITFTTGDQDKLIHIKSLLCQYSTVFPNAKKMTADNFSRQMSKVREKRKKAIASKS